MFKKLGRVLYPMMAPDDALASAKRREEMQTETMNDIGLMEDVISGKVPESQILSGETEGDVNPDIAPPPIDEPDAVADEVVASAEPDLNAPVEPAAVVTPEPKDEYDFSDFINSMARDALGKPQPVTAQPVQQPVTQPIAQPQAAPVVTMPKSLQVPADLVTLEEMTEAFQSPEKFVSLLGKVYMKAASDGAQIAITQLPNIARPIFAQEASLAELSANFYKDNPELNKVRDFVQYCAVQVENAHPDWTAKQIFEETGKVAKQRLPMLKEVAQRQKRAATKPGFVDGQSQGVKNKPSPGKLSALEAEIAAMPVSF